MPSPTYSSPHSMYASRYSADLYRTDGTVASMTASEPFPATPYTTMDSLFMSPNVHQALNGTASLSTENLITNVTSSKFSSYTTIYNLEKKPLPSKMEKDKDIRITTQTYQTTNRYSGKDVFLRRLINMNNSQEDCSRLAQSLRLFRHPNLVSLINITPTEEFVLGSKDIIMEYRHIPGAQSLKDAFFSEGKHVTEGLLWSCACQLVSLLRSFHETYIPLRGGLHWTKILYVPTTGRFYYTGLGLMELVDPAPITDIPAVMRTDIQALGLILFQLAGHSPNLKAENYVNKQVLPGFSISFWELIKTCLEGTANSAQLCHALGERMSMEVGHQEGHADYLFSQCSKESHNGRLMRLMMKLNFALESISDSQEFGDTHRYTLRLFNQYVFNQVDEHNRIQIDWGHAYHCLNKLDCGSEETIQLMGSDANSLLVISYADLRHILDQLIDQLLQGNETTEPEPSSYALGTPSTAL